jgi:hypothetical protein
LHGKVGGCGQARPEAAVQQAVIGFNGSIGTIHVFHQKRSRSERGLYRILQRRATIQVLWNAVRQVLHVRESGYGMLLDGPV